MMVSTIEINIACLNSQLMITRIILQLDKKRSILIKAMKIEFQGHLGIKSYFSFL